MSSVCGNMLTLIPLILIIFLISFDKRNLKRKSSRHFLFALGITALQSILDIIIAINAASAAPSYQITLICRCTTFTLAPFIGYNLLVISMINTSLEKYQSLLKLPLIINAGLSISSLWTGLIFSVTAANVYFRGPLFILQFALSLLYFLSFLALEFSKARRFQVDDTICFIVNFVVMLTAICMQFRHADLILVWSSVSVCLMFYYIAHLHQNLRRDTLTNLFNRHMYERDLTYFNKKHSVTIINIDVNDFKEINDNSGHYYGDEVLQKAAELLQNHFAPYGYTYRVGGDEFCVILDKKLPVTIAAAFTALEEELIPEKKKMGMSKLLSYGYFFYNHKEEKDIYAAVREADNYMYNYKKHYKRKLINI